MRPQHIPHEAPVAVKYRASGSRPPGRPLGRRSPGTRPAPGGARVRSPAVHRPFLPSPSAGRAGRAGRGARSRAPPEAGHPRPPPAADAAPRLPPPASPALRPPGAKPRIRAQSLPGVPGSHGGLHGRYPETPITRWRLRWRLPHVPYRAAALGGSRAPRRARHFFLGNFSLVRRAEPARQEKRSEPGGCDHPGTSRRCKPSPSAPGRHPPTAPPHVDAPRGRCRPSALSSGRHACPAWL